MTRKIFSAITVLMLLSAAIIGWSYAHAKNVVAKACVSHPVLAKEEMEFGQAQLLPMMYPDHKLRISWRLVYYPKSSLEFWEVFVSFDGEILGDNSNLLRSFPGQEKKSGLK